MARHNLGKKIDANGTLEDLGNTISEHDLQTIDFALEEMYKSSNLINYDEYTTETINGVRITNNKNGKYTLNGTSTADFYVKLYYIDNVKPGIYTLDGFFQDVGNDNVKIGIRGIYDYNDETLTCSPLTGRITREITFSEQNCWVRLYIKNGATFTNYVVSPMLVKGKTMADVFYKYSGNIIHNGDLSPVAKSGLYRNLKESPITWWYNLAGPINLWEYKPGIYKTNMNVLIRVGNSTDYSSRMFTTNALLILGGDVNNSYDTTSEYYILIEPRSSMYLRETIIIGLTNSTKTYEVLNSAHIANNLTTDWTGMVLDAYQGKVLNDRITEVEETSVQSEEFLENPAVPDPFANFYTKDETTALINEMTTGHKWDLLWEREYSAYNPSIDSVAVSSKKYDFYAIVYGNDNPQVKIISSLDSTVAGKRFYLTEMSLTQVNGKFTVNLNIRSARLDYSSNESWRYMYFGPAYSLNLYNGYYDNTVTADSACVPRKVYGFNVE